MFSIVFAAIILIASLTHLAFDKQKRTGPRIAEVFLLYIFSIEVGVEGIFGFITHMLYPDMAAEYIGWLKGSQFQQEAAFALLAFGILGIMSVWFRKDFWLATGIGASAFSIGAAIVRIRDIILRQNYAPGNAGALLYNNDIIAPITILILLSVYRKGYSKGPT